MNTQEKMMGNWNQLKGKIKQRWGQLTDDELQEAHGNFDQLVGLVQQKTGEGREYVERVLDQMNEDLGGIFRRPRKPHGNTRVKRPKHSAVRRIRPANTPAQAMNKRSKCSAAGRPSRSPSHSAPGCWLE